MRETTMENVLTGIDASAYATSVCGYAAWAAKRLSRPVELLHIVQRQDAITARKDLSGAIGLGVKSDLMEELVRLSEEGSRTEIEKGRVLLEAGEQLLPTASEWKSGRRSTMRATGLKTAPTRRTRSQFASATKLWRFIHSRTAMAGSPG